MLGEQVVGDERAVGAQRAFGDHARAFDEQVGHDAAEQRTGTRALPSPTTKSIVTPSARGLERAGLDHPAQPHRAGPARGGSATMSLGT